MRNQSYEEKHAHNILNLIIALMMGTIYLTSFMQIIAKSEGLTSVTVEKEDIYQVIDDESVDREFFVTSEEDLRQVIEETPEAGTADIWVTTDMALIDPILINANRTITIRSAIYSDADAVATLRQDNGRHFKISNGHLVLENINLDGNQTGGGVTITTPSGTLIMEAGAVIQNCRGMVAGGVEIIHGTFTMFGGMIQGNKALETSSGGGVFIGNENAVFNLRAGIISENMVSKNFSGGGIFVQNGTFLMEGGRIEENEVRGTSSGGGVRVNAGIFEISGGTIVGNESHGDESGGGILIADTINFTMSSGNIEGNKASGNHSGGGILIDNTLFSMSGGSVKSNEAIGDHSGGGVRVNQGSFSLIGGSIEDNQASQDHSSGGVLVATASFRLLGGNIIGNQSPNGGGIYVNGGIASIEFGSIIGNMATGSEHNPTQGKGGGVFVSQFISNQLVVSHYAQFSQNLASFAERPPINVAVTFPNIQTTYNASIYDHPLNNYDIGYYEMDSTLKTLFLASNVEAGGEILVEGEASLSHIEVYSGTKITLKAVPTTGYRFVEWTSSESNLLREEANQNMVFTVPNNDSTITAIFERERISFGLVPNVLEFEGITTQSELITIHRKDPDWHLTVEDTRLEGGAWRISAAISSPLTSEKDQHRLEDALVFKFEDKIRVLSEIGIIVYEGETTDEEITTVSWDYDEGILLYLRPSDAKESIYTASIIWTLHDTPL